MHSLLDLAESSIAVDINLIIAPFSPTIAVRCDGGQLENALLNILINSRDAIRDSGIGGHIRVEVKVRNRSTGKLHSDLSTDEDSQVEIVLSDDGPGMSEEVLRRAADPFFSTKHDKAGSGLGLSMVYGFVQQSGGELLIKNLGTKESRITGTEITLILEHAKKEPDTQREPTKASVAEIQPARILLVEDEPELAQVLALTLQRMGHDVRTVHNSNDAMNIVQNDANLDLLLTDIVLPGPMDGYSLAREAVNTRPALKVVYLSGYARRRTGSSPLGPVLQKPVSARQLVAVVRRELDPDVKSTLDRELVLQDQSAEDDTGSDKD